MERLPDRDFYHTGWRGRERKKQSPAAGEGGRALRKAALGGART